MTAERDPVTGELEHTWKNGDKLYKLANKYYGTYDLWWVLALVNKKFIDSDFNVSWLDKDKII